MHEIVVISEHVLCELNATNSAAPTATMHSNRESWRLVIAECRIAYISALRPGLEYIDRVFLQVLSLAAFRHQMHQQTLQLEGLQGSLHSL
jgi:hypothetical protein